MKITARPVKQSSDWVLQLINIVFLLLLFFLVNGTIIGQQDVQVDPPKSFLVSAGNPPGDALYISKEGTLSFRGQSVSVQQYVEQLRRLDRKFDSANSELPPIRIVADKQLKATMLVDRLKELRQSGFNEISLITAREPSQ